jgi:hypothetical protein
MRIIPIALSAALLTAPGCSRPASNVPKKATAPAPTPAPVADQAPTESMVPVIPAGPAKPTGTVQERLTRAEELAAKSDHAGAIRLLDEALLLDAKDRQLLFKQAEYCRARSRALAATDPAEAYKLIVSSGSYLRMLNRAYPEPTADERKLALEILYDEASGHARSLRLEETLGTLNELVGAGFRDFDRIRKDDEWKGMRELPQFQEAFDGIVKANAPG